MLEFHQEGWFYFQPLMILLILGFVIDDNFQRGLVHFGFGLLWELRKWVGLLPVPLFVLRQVCDLLHKTSNLLLRKLCNFIIVIEYRSLCDSVNFHQVSSNNTSCLSYSHDGQNWNIYSRLWVQFLCTYHFYEECKSSEEIQNKTACNILCVASSADMNYLPRVSLLVIHLHLERMRERKEENMDNWARAKTSIVGYFFAFNWDKKEVGID